MKRNDSFFHINGVPYFERVRKSESVKNTETINSDPFRIAIDSLNKKEHKHITLLI